MAVRLHGSFKTSNYIVAKFQIHQAERSVQLRRRQGTLAAQLRIEAASNRKTRTLNSLDGLERVAGACEVEGNLLGAGVIEEISGDQPGGRARGMRRQAHFRIRNPYLAVVNRQLSARAVKAPRPRSRLRHIK